MKQTAEQNAADFVDAEIMPLEKKTLGPHAPAELRQKDSRGVKDYVILPLLFLAVTLLGGLRFGAADNAFLFIKPDLICLVYAAILLLLFVRGGLVRLNSWLDEDFALLRNVANAGILLTLFAASTQVFNSVLPEQGIAFWVVAFFFFWTLWNNLFAEFDARKLLRSVGAMFALAFVAKYLVLANLTAAPADGGWLARIFENPGKETFTWLLDLPRYGRASGYVQFFALSLFLLGLYLTPARIGERS